MSETNDKYTRIEKDVTQEEKDNLNELIERFKHHYTELARAQNSVGYSSCALFCKLEISEDDIKANVPKELQTGLFAQSGKYDGVVRFNATTDAAARMSIRVNIPNNVGGPVLDECQESAYPQKYKQIDFLFAEELKEFPFHEYQDLTNLMGLKESFIKFIWGALGRFGTTLSSVKNAKHAKEVISHQSGLVGKSYYGGLPFKLGKNGAMKWAILPKQSHDLDEDNATTPENVEKSAKSYMESLTKWLSDNKSTGEDGAKWDFVIQIAQNDDAGSDDEFNIELGDAKWDESKSPYIKVGTLTVMNTQEIDVNTKLNKLFHPNDTTTTSSPEYNSIQFNPWNMLQAHQPLGPFNRARKEIYPIVSKMRREYGNKEEVPKTCPFLELMK